MPEDICAYALSQPKVHDFLTSRGITSSEILNYKVINTTEFRSLAVEKPYTYWMEALGRRYPVDRVMASDAIMLVGNKLFSVRIGAPSFGVEDSQRAYLSEIQHDSAYYSKDIYGVEWLDISFMTIIDYEELSIN